MFSFLVPIFLEFIKYQSGQALRNKFQGSQEQIQKAVQEQITKILIKFFGGLICTIAICYALIGLFNLIEASINTLAYATEIKVGFYVLILVVSVAGLKFIFTEQKKIKEQEPLPPPQPEFNVQSILSQFLEGLNQGLADSRKKNK